MLAIIALKVIKRPVSLLPHRCVESEFPLFFFFGLMGEYPLATLLEVGSIPC